MLRSLGKSRGCLTIRITHKRGHSHNHRGHTTHREHRWHLLESHTSGKSIESRGSHLWHLSLESHLHLHRGHKNHGLHLVESSSGLEYSHRLVTSEGSLVGIFNPLLVLFSWEKVGYIGFFKEKVYEFLIFMRTISQTIFKEF